MNLFRSGQYNKSIEIMAGVTKHDGSWMATGRIFSDDSLKIFFLLFFCIFLNILCIFSPFSAVYDVLAAMGKLNDTNYMTNDFLNAMIRASGKKIQNLVFSLLKNKFWKLNRLIHQTRNM